MKGATEIADFEKRLGYIFNDRNLIEAALTHKSYAKEHNDAINCNERLEFLGDAFFDCIIGEELFKSFPRKEEGFLSQTRSSVVCEKSLAREATRLGVGEFLLLGNGEEKTGGRTRESLLADALEAIIGAIYLDSDYDTVKKVVLRIFGPTIEDAKRGKFIVSDYKTALQEEIQKDGPANIRYLLKKEEGPDHDKTFTVALFVNDEEKTEGVGKSKKQAEQQAAKAMLEKEI